MSDTGSRNFRRSPRPITANKARAIAQEAVGASGTVTSAIGHADTAAILSNLLGVDLEVNRVSVKLDVGCHALIGQYVGPRLPEGDTDLPEGARIEWWLV